MPWCATLLDAPNTYSYLPNSRNPATNERDEFLSTTLGTDRTLQHVAISVALAMLGVALVVVIGAVVLRSPRRTTAVARH